MKDLIRGEYIFNKQTGLEDMIMQNGQVYMCGNLDNHS